MSKEGIDARWGTGLWKDKLLYSRRSMWAPDTIEKLSKWMELQQGMTTIDVGCGLGYLGYTYWRHFGQNGRYIGADGAPGLLPNALRMAAEWASGGGVEFVAADAHRLPFPGNFADWVTCQAVLMHIPHPEIALGEMIRVARPGALITCTEEDQLSELSTMGHQSLPEPTVEEDLLLRKGARLHHIGRRKLGRGDNAIGVKLAHMMKDQGLLEIDVRTNDRPFFLQPPYAGEVQQDMFKIIDEFWGNQEMVERWREGEKEAFLAGGGSPDEYSAYRAVADCRLRIMQKQLSNRTFATCNVSQWYIAKGRKPQA